MMMTDEDLREQRRARERGSRAVERACQVAVCRCWEREGLGVRWLREEA